MKSSSLNIELKVCMLVCPNNALNIVRRYNSKEMRIFAKEEDGGENTLVPLKCRHYGTHAKRSTQ